MRIKSLHIYPVKGLPGIEIDSVHIEKEGLRNDRRYMIVDESGIMISQRTSPEMTQFAVELNATGIKVEYKDSFIEIPFDTYEGDELEVDVWENKFQSKIVKSAIDSWFSKALNRTCHLVGLYEKGLRKKKLKIAPFETDVSYADGYPILTVGTASLDHLNEKLDTKISQDRFRANIIIETETAHEEDEWLEFELGENVVCKNVKRCARCNVIMIDPQTGKSGKEPSRTLAKYRMEDNEIYFGSNVIVLKEGEVKVGDLLKV